VVGRPLAAAAGVEGACFAVGAAVGAALRLRAWLQEMGRQRVQAPAAPVVPAAAAPAVPAAASLTRCDLARTCNTQEEVYSTRRLETRS